MRLLTPTLSITLVATLLGSCASPDQLNAEVGARATVCPDPSQPLPFPIVRPTCWTDQEWERYLEHEVQRARSGATRFEVRHN